MMSLTNSPFEYALPHIQKLRGYTPGFQPKGDGWVKINTNENPYPPSPAVEAAIKEAMGDALRLYPDPRSDALREEAAKLHGVSSEQVIFGNGSDDILNLLVRAFAQESPAGYLLPSYSLYPVLCGIQGTGTVEVPFDRSMKLPFDALAKIEAKILFVTSPNAPTGVGFSNADLSRLIETFEGIVVVDEAYADFAEENATELLAKYRNLVVTRTFSKSYGLAGLRLGYGLADKDVISLLDRVRDSYNVNRLSQAGGLAALKDQRYLKAVAEKICRTRDYYRAEWEKLGWFCYPSQSNFLFVEPRNAAGEAGPKVAQELFEYLKANKILIRYFPSNPLTESFLRISVGDEDQMLRVSETIQKWLKNA
ncbi:histidinol-phosphate transaminase [Pelagicoccus sp. SDUM812002]|uniref:histidinol-phosphate transaminase n=1 Tax=Pelagicoccus sp. SDUM812002 TaxID=3041266 RepID=UPI00280F3613|nr:histidinol-phosphate transaminase [Pelagicoccus sp. SDUM812002]MDQ8187200.1 histidinol-phosphate transaminase [Pelagicoccus sp. SDUM812002]